MERRRGQRVKRRLPCEFTSGGHRYRGIVVDLSIRGLFLHTDTALEPGEVLDVFLSGTRFPEVQLRTVVARRRFTPAVLATMIRRGVGLRILLAPPEYYEAIEELRDRDETATGSEPETPSIEIVVSDDPADEDLPSQPAELPTPVAKPSARTAPQAAAPPLPKLRSAPSPAQVPLPEPDGAEPAPEPAVEEPAPPGQEEETTWEFVTEPVPPPPPEEPEADPEGEPALPALVPTELPAERPETEPEPGPAKLQSSGDFWISPETPYPCEAILIDSGELDDFYEVLEELGANPVLHRSRDPSRFRGWAKPPRVLVVSARTALRLRLPASAETQGVVTVAVAEADSLTVVSMLRRQGFRYVVRRPVHPEALRLFLLRTLYRDHDRRATGRVAFGYEVQWRKGWSKFKGTLLEISSEGCRLLASEFVNPTSRIRIRIPREMAGGRALELAGRVVRSERRRSRSRSTRVALAIRFERMFSRTRQRLLALLSEYAIGPATLPREPKPHASPLPEEVAVPPVPEPVRPERRRHPRVTLSQEVLALDERLERVRYVLFGQDLSVGGMYVEPHPEVVKGDRLHLALYHASECALVDAEVIRDDGDRGLALAFLACPEETVEKLERMVASLPCLEARGADARGVVIAEILRADAKP